MPVPETTTWRAPTAAAAPLPVTAPSMVNAGHLPALGVDTIEAQLKQPQTLHAAG
jgi:hypothetical protein